MGERIARRLGHNVIGKQSERAKMRPKPEG